MLRYDIVFIILVLSIIDLALAAPVLVQENRQAYADVMHTPKDVITKRVDGDIAKLAEEYLTPWGQSIESSDTHAPSSTAPDSSCSPSMQGLGARGNCMGLPKTEASAIPAQPEPDHGAANPTQPEPDHGAANPTQPEPDYGAVNPAQPEPDHGSANPTQPEPDHGSANSEQPVPDHGSTSAVDASAPPSALSTLSWNHFIPPWSDDEPLGELSGYSSDDDWYRANANANLKPKPKPIPGPSVDPNLDSGPNLIAVPPPSLSQIPELDKVNSLLPDAPPPTKVSSDPGSPSFYSPSQTKNYPYSDPGTPVAYSPSPGAGSPKEPEYVEENPPSSGLVSPKELENGVDHVPSPPSSDPEHQLDYQSLITDSQPTVGSAA